MNKDGNGMKRAIVANADGRFISALVPKASAPSIYEGTRVRVLRELNLQPYANVPPGITGTITYVNAETGVVEVTLDQVVDGLHQWHNCLLLTAFETDDILEGLGWTAVAVQSTCDRHSA
jgi:hypothetical protein